ncbi:MAG: hypothetical protein WED10_04080 [Brumimicrobium sp.]
MKRMLLLILLSFGLNCFSQNGWDWTELAEMPNSTTNNALCGVFVNNQKYVYSFGGISDSLTYADIHQRVYKYNVTNDFWTEEDEVPDTLGKIGASASFVNNKIYLIGGYHVDADSNEYSSDRVHIYNPSLDTFEVDGTSLPTPVNDHVQSVWRDSLIYVISGWSNFGNAPNVQIYNPFFDSWISGTQIPNDNIFKTFGASGYILGDTIYYFGGATEANPFPATQYLRKGIINPNDPTQIDWIYVGDSPGGTNYKSACSGHGSTVFWVGGSQVAHNYDAKSFNDSSIVNPSAKIFKYDVQSNNKENITNTPHTLMDLGGIAKMGGGNWIIAGGLDSLQEVSNKTYLIHNTNLSDIDKALQPPFFEVKENADFYRIVTENVGVVEVYDVSGRKLFSDEKYLADLMIPKSQLSSNILLFVYDDGSNVPVTRKKIQP